MVILRHFEYKDVKSIRDNLYPDFSENDIRNLITERNSCIFQGHYFEMFTVESGSRIVGHVSLYEKSWSVASAGVEILSPSNWKKDAILKYKKYVGAGVREYWIADPRRRTVQVFRKDNGTTCSFYIFDDQIPVGIWDDKLSICLAEYNL